MIVGAQVANQPIIGSTGSTATSSSSASPPTRPTRNTMVVGLFATCRSGREHHEDIAMQEHIPADPAKKAALARDVNTPTVILEELAKSPLVFLREDVARHPNATPELLSNIAPERLESDTDLRIAVALVSNPITPPSVLVSLLRHLKSEKVDGSHRENWKWEDLAVKTLCHRNCPEPEAAVFLSTTHLPRGQKVRIAEHTTVTGILVLLSKDISEQVRRAATGRLNRS